MAKVALLIGVSEYEPGLTPLPGVEEDIKAMERVLHNSDIGGFDKVKTLINCDRQKMEEEIEQLFSNRGKEDLVLLYFSGHGIKDESGQLYFTSCITRKNEQGKLVKATAVEARFVQGTMSNSRSKRQVVILDCCFSGAFAQAMEGKDDGVVDVQNQLGGEGRAILTSSTSTQYSLDCIYTRYIVEGLETGAADLDNDGEVSVEELHEYTKQQVQEAAPAMKPEIYPIKEGYKIILAKVRNDPELRYRKTVERLCARGEISDTGRRILNALRDTLGLSLPKTQEIETEVLLPFITRRNNLHEYEQAYLEAIQSGNSISEHTRNELKDLQQILRLRDEDIAPLIAEPPSILLPAKPPLFRNSNFLNYVIVCIIGVIGVLVGGTLVYYFFVSRTQNTPISVVKTPVNFCAKETYSLNDSISLGEEILVKEDTNPDKEAGVQAFAKGDCPTAIKNFNSYRQVNPTDPEALIYLNNAKARQQGKWLKIAVSVPTVIDPNLAKEILRGVAQAQDEVNNNNGINGKLLQVAITNDNDDVYIGKEIAKTLVKDKEILGVVGNASSSVTRAVSKDYNDGHLVAISPTSTAVEISKSNYVFRTVPSDQQAAKVLANYMVKKLNKNEAAVFFNSNNIYSRSLKDEFVKAVKKEGAQVSQENQFDLYSLNFNAATTLKQATDKGAKVLMLVPSSETIDKARDVVENNHQQLRLNILGGDDVYSQKNLDDWGQQAEGMVVAIPWHIASDPKSKFSQDSKKLWINQVNWRTATSYDATLAIITGLQQSKNREELQKLLHNSSFSFEGATGKIQFSASGDRTTNPTLLVKVQQKPNSDKYEFVPIQP